MIKIRLLTITISSLLAAATLSSCNRSQPNTEASGSITTAAEQGAASVSANPVPLTPMPTLAYADVTDVQPVTEREKIYGTVIDTNAITQQTSTPHQVCNDVTVQERQPERDGNTGGTVVGAVVGGLLGNQVGKGDGRKLATVAGAVAGGIAGHEIDERHQGGRVVTRTEQQCHEETTSSNHVTGYDVTYRRPDGTRDSMRMDSRPSIGSRISLGSQEHVVGYDVTYSYQGKTETIRMDQKPGDRLPVVDGAVVTATAPATHG